LIVRIGTLQQTGGVEEARALGAEALLLTLPTAPERAQLLASLSTIEHVSGHPQAAVDRASESVALYTRLGDGLGQARSLLYRGCFLSEIGDYAAAERDLRGTATLAARFGDVPLQRMALYNVASNFSAQTRPDDALAAGREGWPLAAGPRADEMTVMYRALFIEAYFVRGDWGLLWEHALPALDEVLAIGQPLSMGGVANAALEPLAVLGQWPRALPLVQALDGGLFDELAGNHEVWVACAQAALLQGDPSAAADWLARLRPLAELEQPRVRCRVMLLWAEQKLAMGDAPRALAAMPADDAPGMNDELRLRALALRCAADGSTALHSRARQALSDPRAHAGAALQLERALGGDGLAARVERLAQGLAAWPEVQMSFRATWSGR
jgi:tetratricopeptide (TPR) repeat protein